MHREQSEQGLSRRSGAIDVQNLGKLDELLALEQ